MAISYLAPCPVLIVNDDTGEFVITANITRVVKDKDKEGSLVYVRSDSSAGNIAYSKSYIESPFSPKQLRERLFNISYE